MWLIKMAWLNLWRNKVRTLVSMAAVFFAVVLSVSLTCIQNGAFEHLVNNLVGYYTGYIQVHAAGYQKEQSLDNGFKASPETEAGIRKLKEVSSYSPRLESFALAASGDLTKGVMVVGIDPDREHRSTALKNKLIKGKYLRASSNSVIMGDGLMRRLHLNLHDTLVLLGQGYHGSTAAGKFPVTGVLHFGAPALNDQVLFMPLAAARAFLGSDSLLTSYVIMLNNTRAPDRIAAELSRKLDKTWEVLTWEDMMPDIKQHIESDSATSGIFRGILYLLVSMGIYGTILMMMVERGRELSMLMAIGMSKAKLCALLVMESVFTVMAGCAAGLLVSIPLIYYFHVNPIRFTGELGSSWERFGFEAVIPASTNPDYFIQQGLIVLIIGLLISIYPVLRIIRMNPISHIKK